MLLVIILIIVAVGGLIFWKRYGSSNEKANLEQYYGMTGTDDIAVIVNNQVIAKADNGEYGAGGRLIDEQAYIEYSVLHDFVNKRFYWDANENLLLYTLPQGSVVANIGSKEYTEVSEQKSEEYVIWQTVDNKAYVALDFVKKYTNMECKEYQDPNRVMIVNEFGKTTVAEMKRDTQVRFQGGVKSPILTEVKKSEKVTVIEDEDGWKKVRTSDGFIGYVQTNSLKHIKEETISSSFEEPQYTGISKDYKINMAWRNFPPADHKNPLCRNIHKHRKIISAHALLSLVTSFHPSYTTAHCRYMLRYYFRLFVLLPRYTGCRSVTGSVLLTVPH